MCTNFQKSIILSENVAPTRIPRETENLFESVNLLGIGIEGDPAEFLPSGSFVPTHPVGGGAVLLARGYPDVQGSATAIGSGICGVVAGPEPLNLAETLHRCAADRQFHPHTTWPGQGFRNDGEGGHINGKRFAQGARPCQAIVRRGAPISIGRPQISHKKHKRSGTAKRQPILTQRRKDAEAQRFWHFMLLSGCIPCPQIGLGFVHSSSPIRPSLRPCVLAPLRFAVDCPRVTENRRGLR